MTFAGLAPTKSATASDGTNLVGDMGADNMVYIGCSCCLMVDCSEGETHVDEFDIPLFTTQLRAARQVFPASELSSAQPSKLRISVIIRQTTSYQDCAYIEASRGIPISAPELWFTTPAASAKTESTPHLASISFIASSRFNTRIITSLASFTSFAKNQIPFEHHATNIKFLLVCT